MNEPAFPTENILHKGMTLRDYFAAKAMQGKLASGTSGYTEVAKHAYKYADAMMEARNAAQ